MDYLYDFSIWFKLYSMWYKFQHFTTLLIFVKLETSGGSEFVLENNQMNRELRLLNIQ